ncbi:MAG: hypothetical protein U1F51_16255 [Burkholderiales bacterium]|jgi:hypothetical protein
MDAYAPDFTACWKADRDEFHRGYDQREELPSAADEQAMAELVDRVSAARSVI